MVNGLKAKYMQHKSDELVNVSTYAPQFHLRYFLRHWLYNFLFLMAFGPLGSLIMICMENKTYVENMGFLPGTTRLSLTLFMLQTSTWALYSIPLILLVRDQY